MLTQSTWRAFLRAVNVAGTGRVSMKSLLTMLERLGFEKPRSLLQSGNLLLHDRGRSAQELEDLLQAETQKRLKLRTEYFVRAPKEWSRMVDANPFLKQAGEAPALLHVVFLKLTPPAPAVAALRSSIEGPELIESAGSHL